MPSRSRRPGSCTPRARAWSAGVPPTATGSPSAITMSRCHRGARSRPNGTNDYMVRITYNGRTSVAPVYDVGPWNAHDDYWNEQRQRYADLPRGYPEDHAAYFDGYNGGRAEQGRVRFPTAIDIGDGAWWDDLGIKGDRAVVEVTFLWLGSDPAGRATSAPPAPPAEPAATGRRTSAGGCTHPPPTEPAPPAAPAPAEPNHHQQPSRHRAASGCTNTAACAAVARCHQHRASPADARRQRPRSATCAGRTSPAPPAEVVVDERGSNFKAMPRSNGMMGRRSVARAAARYGHSRPRTPTRAKTLAAGSRRCLTRRSTMYMWPYPNAPAASPTPAARAISSSTAMARRGHDRPGRASRRLGAAGPLPVQR